MYKYILYTHETHNNISVDGRDTLALDPLIKKKTNLSAYGRGTVL